MIDLGEEFKRMTTEFGLTDKEAFVTIRTMVRQMWNKSEYKLRFFKSKSKLVKNENPRSMKKYPYVTKYQCTICGEWFSANETEIDHVVSENALTSYEHINDFMINIVLTSPDKLQVLCKDKKSKKFGVTRFGCHSIKTFSERYGVDLDTARAEKEAKQLVDKKLDKEYLQEHQLHVESTRAARRATIVAHKLSLLNKGENSD